MAGNSLHQQWWVQPHPARPLEIQKASNHGIETTLETYQSISFYYQFLNKKTEQPLVLLGLDESFSIWTVIARERMYNGEELITLKSRNSLGILPIINDKKILDEFRASVKDSIEGFVDDVYRATPISLIHRARDVACHILLAYFELKANTVLELAPLAEKLEKEEKKIIGASAAKIIAMLHSRAKPNEQEKHSLPQIREQDAQLAVQCVGTILCEIGWAKWQ